MLVHAVDQNDAYITSREQRDAERGWSPQASEERGTPSSQALPLEGSTSLYKYHVGDQAFSTWGFGDTQDPKCSSKHMVVVTLPTH